MPTHFRVEGTVLIQTVNPSPTATYPIVADPRITWGFPVSTVWFDRNETTTIASGAAACSFVVSKSPQPLGIAMYFACGAMSIYAGYLLGTGRCLAVNVNTPVAAITPGGGVTPFGYRC